MKKSLLIITIGTILASCSSKSELTPEELNSNYEKAAFNYFESEVEGDKEVASVRSVKVDTIEILSSKKLAIHEYRKLTMMYEMGIDPLLSDTLLTLNESANRKSKTDTAAYAVRFNLEVVMRNGSIEKSFLPILYFDLNHELSAEWNK